MTTDEIINELIEIKSNLPDSWWGLKISKDIDKLIRKLMQEGASQ